MRLRLVIVAATLALSACGDSSGPKPVPTSIELVTAPSGAATAGVPLTTSPVFVAGTDAFDNPIPGGQLSVTVVGGGSAVTDAPADAAGVATIPTWTLGTVKGTQTIRFSIPNGSLTFSVAVIAGPIQTFNLI